MNVFNSARRLKCQTLWLLFLFHYKRVSRVWPIHNRDITCFLLDFLKAGLHSPKVGWIWKSLLWMLSFHHFYHFVWRNLLIWGFRSVYGIQNLSRFRSKADLAAESALSLLPPMWLRIQHIIMYLQFDIEFSLFNSLMIRGFSNFLFLNDSKTESESEYMINFLCLFFEMISRATYIARASAVKMDISVGGTFLIIVLFRTAAQAVFSLTLEPSVKTYRWSGLCWRILWNFYW